MRASAPSPPVRYIRFDATSRQSASTVRPNGSSCRERGDVGHRRIQIGRADGMADGLRLLDDRLVILPIGEIVVDREAAARLERERGIGMWTAAFVEKELRLVQILAIAGRLIKLDEGELDLLMAGHIVARVRAEVPCKPDPRS